MCALCSDASPPFSSISGKIPFSPLLPLGLAPCSSGKITGILLTDKISCSLQLQHWHFYSELGFLSIGLFTHSASLVWPHRDFPTAQKNFTLQNPLCSQCVLRTKDLPQFSSLFFRTLKMTVEKMTKHAMFHVLYDHFQHLVFQFFLGI